MPVRGVYNKEEEAFLARIKAFKLPSEWVPEYEEGRPWPVYLNHVSKDYIQLHCIGIADINPLYNDEAYGAKSRWKSIIAPPFFPYCISQGGSGVWDVMSECPKSLGVPTANNAGSNWDFHQVIRPGDTFRLREGQEQTITDITREGANSPRQFLWSRDKFYVNQTGEPAATCHRRIYWLIVPPDKEGRPQIATNPKAKAYVYTKEELAAADRTWEQEIIRGAVPRFWEDVKPGDDLQPVIDGPITVMEQVGQIAGEIPKGTWRTKKKIPGFDIEDPVTHVWHGLGDYHLEDRIAQAVGISTAFTEGTRADMRIGRLLSHWYGDDGFLRRYDSQHRNFCPLGDTVWGRGKVVRKYVADGQPMVAVACWTESIRGWLNTISMADVILPSRGAVPASFDETLALPDIRPGDTVRVKNRPDWPIPYRFAGFEGVVYQYKKPMGVVGVHVHQVGKSDQVFDTLRPGMSLLFRVENLEVVRRGTATRR